MFESLLIFRESSSRKCHCVRMRNVLIPFSLSLSHAHISTFHFYDGLSSRKDENISQLSCGNARARLSRVSRIQIYRVSSNLIGLDSLVTSKRKKMNVTLKNTQIVNKKRNPRED